MTIIQTTLRHTSLNASEQLMMLTHEVSALGLPDQDIVDAMADYLSNQWAPRWQALAASSSTLTRADLVALNPDGTVDRNLGSITVGATGSGSQPVLPAATSALMVGNVAAPNRRGLKYVPCITEGVVQDGILTDVALQNLVELAIEYLTPIIIDLIIEMAPGILDKVAGVFHPFTRSGYVTDVPAYQRRRKPGVGS